MHKHAFAKLPFPFQEGGWRKSSWTECSPPYSLTAHIYWAPTICWELPGARHPWGRDSKHILLEPVTKNLPSHSILPAPTATSFLLLLTSAQAHLTFCDPHGLQHARLPCPSARDNDGVEGDSIVKDLGNIRKENEKNWENAKCCILLFVRFGILKFVGNSGVEKFVDLC